MEMDGFETRFTLLACLDSAVVLVSDLREADFGSLLLDSCFASFLVETGFGSGLVEEDIASASAGLVEPDFDSVALVETGAASTSVVLVEADLAFAAASASVVLVEADLASAVLEAADLASAVLVENDFVSAVLPEEELVSEVLVGPVLESDLVELEADFVVSSFSFSGLTDAVLGVSGLLLSGAGFTGFTGFGVVSWKSDLRGRRTGGPASSESESASESNAPEPASDSDAEALLDSGDESRLAPPRCSRKVTEVFTAGPEAEPEPEPEIEPPRPRAPVSAPAPATAPRAPRALPPRAPRPRGLPPRAPRTVAPLCNVDEIVLRTRASFTRGKSSVLNK